MLWYSVRWVEKTPIRQTGERSGIGVFLKAGTAGKSFDPTISKMAGFHETASFGRHPQRLEHPGHQKKFFFWAVNHLAEGDIFLDTEMAGFEPFSIMDRMVNAEHRNPDP